jgi:UDP-N-acetyl-D-glucosamine dehydrogenase
MTKLLENIYRCVNIALVNELKQLCMRMGIDIHEVIDAAKTKPFGFQAFYPGPGLGGHCIPIDPFYLSWKAKQFDFRTRFIELAGEVNTAMPYFVLDQIAAASTTTANPSKAQIFWSSAWPTNATSTTCANPPRSPSSNCSAIAAPP